MDWLFGEQNNSSGDFDSTMDSYQSTDQFDSGFETTTIVKSLDMSPIRKPSANADQSYGSVYDFEGDLSFDKSKSSRNYFCVRRSLPFSPISGSTPKPSKTKTVRRTQVNKRKKKSYRKASSDVSLWDKAIVKNPELKHWINSFNEDMKKIESSELSVTKDSLSSPK